MVLPNSFTQIPVRGAEVGSRRLATAPMVRFSRAGILSMTLAAGLSPGPTLPSAFAQQTELQLYRRFALAPPGHWADVTVPWATEGWRVGTPDGPHATAADLARWRSAPGLVVVVGRCSGAQSDNTHYPCAFELTPSTPPAGRPADWLAALAPWQTTSDERLAHFDQGVVHASSMARGGMGPVAQPLLRGLLPDDPTLLGFYAPAVVLQVSGATVLPTLRLRGVDNPLQRARFDREGLLVLSTRRIPFPAPARAASERPI